MAERYTKTYVSVNVDIDEDGTMLPRLIRWMNGRVFAGINAARPRRRWGEAASAIPSG